MASLFLVGKFTKNTNFIFIEQKLCIEKLHSIWCSSYPLVQWRWL